MTTITFYRCGDHVREIVADGHSGYASYGEDIACAAISTVMQMGARGFEICGALDGTPVRRGPRQGGYFAIRLNEPLPGDNVTLMVVAMIRDTLKAIAHTVNDRRPGKEFVRIVDEGWAVPL